MAGQPLTFQWIEFTMIKDFGEHNAFGIDVTYQVNVLPEYNGLGYINT
jgi:hypothetical protein